MISTDSIHIRGARQNNLKGFDLKIPLNKLTVLTGVSGSGKSSLAFDTIYAEGQRRYVETFSAYTRQFLDRMDKPRVDRIEGIPPAIAIDQTNPVRTSRSTVGTMTELNDHMKLLFARAARLHCAKCGKPVERDTPQSVFSRLLEVIDKRDVESRIQITFPVNIPHNFSEEEIRDLLQQQGYQRITKKGEGRLEVVQDRVVLEEENRDRIVEDLEAALEHGQGSVSVYPLSERGRLRRPFRFSKDLHCADCEIHYQDPFPNLFSFNSPIGACETCRGFGRIIDIDFDLVVPDDTKTLDEGAVRPWQSPSYSECQDDLESFAARRGFSMHKPWRELTEEEKKWVLEGEGNREDGKWYGVRRFFKWLETKSYKMHIRVLLAKYRAYRTCPGCGAARLKPEALLWRIGRGRGLNVHEVMLQPIAKCWRFFKELKLPGPMDEAAAVLLTEIRTRLRYLVDVGLGYLTLDRQSRTLSGGEVQRINLTTALGTSLVNTLFILDEPSIGLHHRDIKRLIGVLHRLRDAGNTLIVVEHDPEVIRAADFILDLGPGPGERGGKVVFFGPLKNLYSSRRSLTAKYLTGEKRVWTEEQASVEEQGHAQMGRQVDRSENLEILGAREHNLKNIDVSIPLNRLVCITGVSGSGKSTLVQDVCYRALRKLKHKPVESPGLHRDIGGHEQVSEVISVDQSPIGRTTRSNPASYVGALDAIRKLFAAEPLAKQRGYTAGTFSFNSGRGRCPTCGGNGFERIEMQFLSDIYLRCPDCNGRRYRSEVLDVKVLSRAPAASAPRSLSETHHTTEARSIAGVLDMTVSEACAFFSEEPEVLRGLEPLMAVGLGYMSLGQPVPTMSGGEAQRLKLAGYLAKSNGRNGSSLFLFDEPTTGLHFDDISTLLRAFRALVEAGHSVVVIEHNLEVMAAADWIIDLGPEGGEAGGEIVCVGPPAEVKRCRKSHTGKALRAHEKKAVPLEPPVDTNMTPGTNHSILIRHAREHNLKNIDVRIPRDGFTVITGVSGSGKSTVAFDILFNEGQRRYLESLNAYARQFMQPAARPEVDGVFGIPPTVAIEQRTSRGGRKSTVATVTEVYHFLRLLFVKLGVQYCPDCQVPIEPQTREAILSNILRNYRGRKVALYSPLVVARKGYYTDLARWASNKGYSNLRVDGKLLSTDSWPRLDRFKEHNIELPIGVVKTPKSKKGRLEVGRLLDLALDLGKGVVYLVAAEPSGGQALWPSGGQALWPSGGQALWPSGGQAETVFSIKRACPSCDRSFEELDPRLFSFNSKHGWCPRCFGTGLLLSGFDADQTGEERWWNEWWEGAERSCPECQGKRLRREALAVRFRDMTITDYTALSVDEAESFFKTLNFSGREAEIARDIVAELCSRLSFLKKVGLPYLSLDRGAPTLSGGEAQRIRLASQLGSNLRGVCYILDEPTIGLHARDSGMLLKTLNGLRAKGNTVVVVEHDEQTIRQAQYVVDLGPGGGLNGGHLVDAGPIEDLMKNRRSVTGRLLSEPLRHPFVETHRGEEARDWVEIHDARLHNLKNLEVRIPLNRMVCITGVSGSGKSTLMRDVLYENLRRMVSGRRKRRAAISKGVGRRGCSHITGWESLQRILEVDQTPIGKTPRSCPATYVGFWDDIRRLFAGIPDARMRGYTPSRFSFNVLGGRCEKCGGQGLKRIEMNFLPDVSVVCETCGGKRFNQETLSIQFRDKSIADILDMNVDEAVGFFAFHPKVHHALSLLQDVGLGYLTLGQQSPTLSGGEAQRIKLVTELAKTRPNNGGSGNGRMKAGASTGTSEKTGEPQKSLDGRSNHALYVLDEPTIGLHMADVERLVKVLHRLVDNGSTIVIIEHNLDVIAEADWIIDLGPEGGEGGGWVVAEGAPRAVARVRNGSYTGRYLARFLRERGVPRGA